ncbi:MAG TPA: hypothetical protein VKO66_08410, partial [Sideroxyarcus sp.]|nr:hypothetical protein [Sideroxyarcus sp.]
MATAALIASHGRKPLGWRAQLAAFLIGFALVISHRPDAVWNPQFWAEDAVIYYLRAYELGWRALALPVAGYLGVMPQLVAVAVQALPLALAPLAMNLVAIALEV